jgi:poly-gamma-glutamate synthesis protein (capsule biosynthesis protein)
MKIIIAGDFCPQLRVAKCFDNEDFVSVLGEIKSVIDKTDYSIINFECPICDGEESPIEKCGSNLNCSVKGMKAIKWIGFSCVTLANNHFLDYGVDGVKTTLDVFKKNKIDTVGGGMDINEASRILYKDIGDEKLAVINCCEHEFSIATDKTAGSNPLNPIQQFYAIQEARQTSNYVIVIVHGGNEYYQLPSPRMKELYRFFIDAGADAVINHHQHCYSGYEFYKGKPIVYGLGNFCFDEKNDLGRIWNEGYMAQIDFENNYVNLTVIPYIQCLNEPKVRPMNNTETETFNSRIHELNTIINNDVLLKHSYDSFLKQTYRIIDMMFNPYKGRLMKGLYRHHLLPSLIDREMKMTLYNYVLCESHLPKIIDYLKK